MSRPTLLLTRGIRHRIQTQRHLFRRHTQRRNELSSCQLIPCITIPPVTNLATVSHRHSSSTIAATTAPPPTTTQKRSFSDNLLGHSPMARPAITNKNVTPQKTTESTTNINNPGKSGPSWGVDANTEGGGVWAQTSSKREKLTELRGEITEGKLSLDDMATVEELKELYFADGLTLVVRAVDEAWDMTGTTLMDDDDDDATTTKEDGGEHSFVKMFDKWLGETEAQRDSVDRNAFEAHLSLAESRIDQYLVNEQQRQLNNISSSSPLSLLPEFIFEDDQKQQQQPRPSPSLKLHQRQIQSAFASCVQSYKLLLVKHTAATLRSSWDVITSLTDADVDRAATTEGIDATPVGALPLTKVNDVLRASSSTANTTCRDRFDAYWRLVDKDDDGRLDQKTMDDIVRLSLKPTEMALVDFATRAVPMVVVASNDNDDNGSSTKEGWRQRRRRTKIQKRLTKMIAAAAGRHFDEDVELPHRLRCIYAWAEKAHQDGKVDSVLVDTGAGDDLGGAIMGRKRYVELDPLISLEEFRSIQSWHFKQFDKVAEEMMKGFREDLWVHQGKGRQYKELKRDCALFIAVVSLIDLGIIYM